MEGPNCEVADIERRWGTITVEAFRRDYPGIANELQRLTNIAVDLKDARRAIAALEAENAELRKARERLIERVVSIRMTGWINKRDGNFTATEAIEAERATREGVENWLRRPAAIDRAREGKP